MIVAAAKIGSGKRDQVVPKVATVAISVAPQEVLWPSKATVEAIASKLNANSHAAEPS
ncbi:hypothetical protein ABXT21_22525 [Ralstonia sp. SM1864_UCD524_TZ4]|uniref:Uncharacterized protein n=1 Tax=Ralstonia solanacearum TaxID=305 RepID=A0A0S4VLC4_RALSL|nr:hypothetical protein [Ralstonia pseudosolanacearum]CUV35198.1 protein of unknown function [Ralstonia solanacearum]CUV39576.1 protein of unknown function [Ralstonia solanacearum]